jgi:hypothetical protein
LLESSLKRGAGADNFGISAHYNDYSTRFVTAELKRHQEAQLYIGRKRSANLVHFKHTVSMLISLALQHLLQVIILLQDVLKLFTLALLQQERNTIC